ncbi:TetR/AcrR family transcriptional regulator C-terminal domain-containing protein [Virgisporangium aurantiacum]|uniref:GntR family transcriptional regulator n=1 Tax=Virgisporangium aurantiacum TaxID=175570 RepID=A0A8J4E6R2_9ACTN|nr:TetR/AcrR family transcriptional regulator C-terminal domain-containing protein [Virgisporangium aurantiacum]GIJ63418.1 GntR family transcriptional regulator [Virgisporangium aurantiacum]
MTEPPYQRIVADLRRRIAAGELRPGDRVPSTRQLTIRWGVALATATKALATLRQEGLVRAVPRVGTVVAEPAPAPASRPGVAAGAGGAAGGAGAERDLSRQRIVQVAIEVADAEGLEALSMRGIAARVGAATMSTYRHVTSKDDLVMLMADAAFGELPPATHDDGAGWRERVAGAVRTLWTLHRRHPWLAHLSPLTRPLPLPHLLAHGEQILAAFADTGLDPHTTLDLQVLLYSYVQGLAINIEREAHAAATTGVSEDEWMRQQGPAMGAIAATGRYPAFTRLMDAFAVGGYDLDLDRIFELGLGLMLDGLTPMVEAAPVKNGTRTAPG